VQKEDNMFEKIVNYCKACYDELAHKTTWPTRAELTHSAVIVLSASLVIALVVFAMDFVFKNLMGVIYPG
jgi:preprotein translocase subunit SecE